MSTRKQDHWPWRGTIRIGYMVFSVTVGPWLNEFVKTVSFNFGLGFHWGKGYWLSPALNINLPLFHLQIGWEREHRSVEPRSTP